MRFIRDMIHRGDSLGSGLNSPNRRLGIGGNGFCVLGAAFSGCLDIHLDALEVGCTIVDCSNVGDSGMINWSFMGPDAKSDRSTSPSSMVSGYVCVWG